MVERTQLGETILRHWRENCPGMVRDLELRGRLDETVSEAQDRTGDLLYELVSVQGMDYQGAWEMAMREWALPSEEDRTQGGKRPREKSSSGKPKSSRSRARARGRRRGTSA